MSLKHHLMFKEVHEAVSRRLKGRNQQRACKKQTILQTNKNTFVLCSRPKGDESLWLLGLDNELLPGTGTKANEA